MRSSKKLSAAEAAQAFEKIVEELSAGQIEICILGTSPFIYNAVSLKARQELLFPRARLTSSQRAMTLKHDPMSEFRNSVYRRRQSETGSTRLVFPCPAFKGVVSTAALDLPSDVTKAKIGRLTWIEGDRLDIYGVPEMLMSVVRNSDIGHTPDIRSRAILPRWCCRVTIRYVRPILNERVLSGLLSMGGLTVGIGDFRQEKGKGSYGQFEICEAGNPRFQEIIENGGMAAQDAALRDPEFYDAETEELYAWFCDELLRRRGNTAMQGASDEDDEDSTEVGFGNGADADSDQPDTLR